MNAPLRNLSRGSSAGGRAARLLPLLFLLLAPAVLRAASPITDAEVRFNYALAALAQGDTALAEELLLEAITLDPEHGDAHLQLALIDISRGNGGNAISALRAALASEHPPSVPRSWIEERLRKTERDLVDTTLIETTVPPEALESIPVYGAVEVGRSATPRFEGRLGFGYANDSNPAAVPDGLTAVAPGEAPLVGPQSDSVGNLDLRLAAYPGGHDGRWSLGTVLDLDQSFYQELGYLDRGRARFTVHLAAGGDPQGFLAGPLGYTRTRRSGGALSALFQVGVTATRADGRSARRSLSGALALTFREGRSLATQLDAEYHDDEYSDDPPGALDRTGTRSRVGLSQYFYLGRRDRYLRLGAAAGDRDAGAALDHSLREARAELSLPLAARWHLFLLGLRRQREFDRLESNPLFPTFFADRPRDDTETLAAATLVWTPLDCLQVVGRVSRLTTDTDLGPALAAIDFGYDRTVTGLAVRWLFRSPGGAR